MTTTKTDISTTYSRLDVIRAEQKDASRGRVVELGRKFGFTRKWTDYG